MNVIAHRYVTPTPIDVTTLIINYIPLLYTDKLNFAVGLQKKIPGLQYRKIYL